MSKIKIVFFPDQPHDDSNRLKAELAKKFGCYESSNIDEFDQVFQQSGKFAILFSDAQVAVKFLHKNKSEMNPLTYKVFAYLNKLGKFSPESQKVLDQFKVNVYQKNEFDKLVTDITGYLSGADVVEQVDDIQFFTPGDE